MDYQIQFEVIGEYFIVYCFECREGKWYAYTHGMDTEPAKALRKLEDDTAWAKEVDYHSCIATPKQWFKLRWIELERERENYMDKRPEMR